MDTQTLRHANLRRVLEQLEREGFATLQAQAVYLEGGITAAELEAMLDGGEIDDRFAAHVERRMFKPAGWMSQADAVQIRQAD